jgi:hypothetical protein
MALQVTELPAWPAPSSCCVLANLVPKMLRPGHPKPGLPGFHWGSSMSGFLTARQYMVDCQVRPSDVTDNRIADAMLAVPREAFVPQNQRAMAYLDIDLDVSEGAPVKRFLIKPAVTARMLQAAEILETETVLVVGCATGYTGRCDRKRPESGRQGQGDPGRTGTSQCHRPHSGDPRWGCDKCALRRHRPQWCDRSPARGPLPAAPGGRPTGRGVRRHQAATGHDRHAFSRRFRRSRAF